MPASPHLDLPQGIPSSALPSWVTVTLPPPVQIPPEYAPQVHPRPSSPPPPVATRPLVAPPRHRKRVRKERRNEAVMITGGILAAAGAAAITTGAIVSQLGLPDQESEVPNCTIDQTQGVVPACLGSPHSGLETAGIGLLVGGAIGFVVGIPMFFYGSKMVDKAPPQPAGWVPEVHVGTRSVSLDFRF